MQFFRHAEFRSNSDARDRRSFDLLPAHPKLAPGFCVHARGSHAPELVQRPLLGLREIGRARQSRPNTVEQSAGVFHDVRVVEALVADARDRREVESFSGQGGTRRSLGFFRSERRERQC